MLTSLAWIEGDLTTSPDELRRLVRERKEQGADLVKVFASSSQRVGAKPTLTEAQLKVVCDEARALGLRTMVHAYRGQVSAAARAGCGQVEHATYATREDLEIAARAGTFISPQVGLVVQNYLENKARYLGVGNYTEEGMAIMARDLPLDFEVCRLALGVPGGEGGVLHRRHRRRPRAQRGGAPRSGGALRADPDGRPRLRALPGRGIAGPGRSPGGLGPRLRGRTLIAVDGDPLTDLRAVRRIVFVMRGGVVYKWTGAPSASRRARPSTR